MSTLYIYSNQSGRNAQNTVLSKDMDNIQKITHWIFDGFYLKIECGKISNLDSLQISENDTTHLFAYLTGL